ncbi:MAG: sulfotransferase [Pseudomonadota bacterium]
MLMIIGSGRSGTTWLGKLFDSHPDTVYLHEPDAVLRCPDLPTNPDPQEVAAARDAAAAYLARLRRVRTPGVTGVSPHFAKNYRGFLRGGFHRSTMIMGKVLRRAAGHGRWAGPPVPLAPRAHSKGLYVLKSGGAVGRASLWATADPALKIVHLIRHVGGRIASLERGMAAGMPSPDPQLAQLFELPESQFYPFTKKDLQSRRLIEQLAWSWMIQNDKAAADLEGSPRYAPVVYEDLCRAPADKTMRLFAFAGLEPSARSGLFLRQLQRPASDRSRRSLGALKSPVGSIDHWRDELSLDEQDSIMEIVSHARTAPVRQALGLT